MIREIKVTLDHEAESICKDSRLKEQKEPVLQYHPWILGLKCEKEAHFHLCKLQHVILIFDSITELLT